MPVPVFTSGEILTAANMNAVGLWRVTGCTVTSVGGTAATASNGVITVGTGNTSVTVSNTFSSNFENYRIIYNGGSSSVEQALGMRLGASAAGYYGGVMTVAFSTGAVTGGPVNNAAQWTFAGAGSTTGNGIILDVLRPFEADETMISGAYNYPGAAGAGSFSGYHNSAVSYSSFVIVPGAGSITGGTIRVYGYNN